MSVAAARFTGRTAWARSLQTPLREFLRTETGGAAVLLAAAAAALVGGHERAAACRAIPVATTIQAAVDQAQPCDWVVIPPGTYAESIVVTTPNLHLRGLNRNTVVLDAVADGAAVAPSDEHLRSFHPGSRVLRLPPAGKLIGR